LVKRRALARVFAPSINQQSEINFYSICVANRIRVLKLSEAKTRAKALRLTKFFNFFVLGLSFAKAKDKGSVSD